MISGAHAIIYSKKPEADRAFLRDVLELGSVDVGDGWLIFGLPPSEVAVHPAEKNDVHELYFLVDDVEKFVAAMSEHGVKCGPVANRGWGLLTEVKLPGGGKLGVYQPRHARPDAGASGGAARGRTRRAAAATGRSRRPPTSSTSRPKR